jgi:hypothetical protein
VVPWCGGGGVQRLDELMALLFDDGVGGAVDGVTELLASLVEDDDTPGKV